jgi:hypothetical protein
MVAQHGASRKRKPVEIVLDEDHAYGVGSGALPLDGTLACSHCAAKDYWPQASGQMEDKHRTKRATARAKEAPGVRLEADGSDEDTERGDERLAPRSPRKRNTQQLFLPSEDDDAGDAETSDQEPKPSQRQRTVASGFDDSFGGPAKATAAGLGKKRKAAVDPILDDDDDSDSGVFKGFGRGRKRGKVAR